MKKTLPLCTLIMALMISACVPQVVDSPAPLVTEPTQVAAVESPAVTNRSDMKSYANSDFGLNFQFPANWFGPEEYISDQNLRVEIGSDQVYPYGTDPSQRIYEFKNSYAVLLQYSKSNQDQYWRDLYQSLINLQDGESLSDARGMLIRVRQLKLGRFEGIEYISTLSESAQTEPAYSRSLILLDPESTDLLTVIGQPINVEVNEGENWRDIYQRIDQENQAIFDQIVESITIQ